MIISSQGNLLDANVDALVNTVNCVGVMGKGIALQFKRRYPAVFKAYEKACRDGEVQIGRMFVVETEQIEGPRFVVNFPTKKHWRSPSKLEYIEAGLDDLKRVIGELGIESIAIPPLGAGNGGLDWTAVEPVIRESLHDLDEVRILIYAPADQQRSIAPSSNLRMTRVRAMLLTLLNDYVHQRQVSEPWEDPRGASHLEIQKLMYFANVHDESLKLDFAPGRYGPYSEKVRHLVQDMEGGYLSGFGDGTGTVMALEPIAPTSEGLEALSASEGSYPDLNVVTSGVLKDLEGFEGPYGVELLASTHWVTRCEGADSVEAAAVAVKAWTKRKGRIYTSGHIATAYEHLQRTGALAVG